LSISRAGTLERLSLDRWVVGSLSIYFPQF
jgi:hypothetical protein